MSIKNNYEEIKNNYAVIKNNLDVIKNNSFSQHMIKMEDYFYFSEKNSFSFDEIQPLSKEQDKERWKRMGFKHE